MKNALDFIRFALSHAKLETIPLGAKLPLDIEECGAEEWEYLPGMKGEQVTDELIEAKYENFYKLFGWTRERFDHVTTNFARKRVHACDSQGLLTAYTGMEATPNYCYSAWCTEKGRIVFDLDEPDYSISVGTRASIYLVVESKKQVLAVPRVAVYGSEENGYYVYVLTDDGVRETVDVQVGLIGNNYIEILGGIEMYTSVIVR